MCKNIKKDDMVMVTSTNAEIFGLCGIVKSCNKKVVIVDFVNDEYNLTNYECRYDEIELLENAWTKIVEKEILDYNKIINWCSKKFIKDCVSKNISILKAGYYIEGYYTEEKEKGNQLHCFDIVYDIVDGSSALATIFIDTNKIEFLEELDTETVIIIATFAKEIQNKFIPIFKNLEKEQ